MIYPPAQRRVFRLVFALGGLMLATPGGLAMANFYNSDHDRKEAQWQERQSSAGEDMEIFLRNGQHWVLWLPEPVASCQVNGETITDLDLSQTWDGQAYRGQSLPPRSTVLIHCDRGPFYVSTYTIPIGDTLTSICLVFCGVVVLGGLAVFIWHGVHLLIDLRRR